MKYNVFISSKSEDYSFAEEVYNFLVSNGLSVFLACRELDRLGDSEYSQAIDTAIDNSAHMIVIGSSIKHLESKWVRYEWSTFSNDLKSGYRNGNLITILNPQIRMQELPASLRHQQSFFFDTYEQHILSYVGADDSMLAKLLDEAREEVKALRGEIEDARRRIYDLSKLISHYEFECHEKEQEISQLKQQLAMSLRDTMLVPSAPEKINDYHKVYLEKVGISRNMVKKCIVHRVGMTPDEADTFINNVPCELFGTYTKTSAEAFVDELRHLGASASVI